MTFTNNKMRGVAIFTGGVLAATALFHPAPAQADEEKDKLYKSGAAALGVLGAYFILKGKTVPGVIAGAGAYYAYKKGKEAQNDERYDDGRYSDNRSRGGRYSNNDSRDSRYPNNSYPDNDYAYGDDSNDVYTGTDYSDTDYSDDYYSSNSDTDYTDDVYDGRWKTPSSNSNRNRNDRSDDYDYRGVTPGANDDGSTLVLE